MDAERSVLGAVLIEPERLGEARDRLSASDFYRTAHAAIFRAYCAVADRGDPLDLSTVQRQLERDGLLEETGGPVYLAGLVDGVPRTSNIAHYAAVVSELSERRRVLQALRAASAAVREHGSTTEALDPLRLALEGMRWSGMDHGAGYDRRVAEALEIERVRREVRRRLDAEDRGLIELPAFEHLGVVLERPVEPGRERLVGWLPLGGNAVIAAQFKAGKTTLVDNLTRTLVDGDAFLGRAPVRVVSGTVVRLDVEMSVRQGTSWLRLQQIRRHSHVIPLFLRGRAATFNVLAPEIRARWAAELKRCACEVLIVDCLRPILDALGLDEHKDVGRFLVALDALKAEAGVRELVLVVHMGHNGERARGDSRTQDWPDVTIRLVRQDDDPASPRYISAFGRDVDQPEQRLKFEPEARRLVIEGGSRLDARKEAALDAVLDVLRATSQPLNGSAIKKALVNSDHSRDAVDAALRTGRGTGRLCCVEGPRNTKLYRPASELPAASGQYPAESASEFPAASIEAGSSGHRTDDAASGAAGLYDGAPSRTAVPSRWQRGAFVNRGGCDA